MAYGGVASPFEDFCTTPDPGNIRGLRQTGRTDCHTVDRRAGQRDAILAPACTYMLAACALDADWLRNSLSEHGVMPVIPPRKKRKPPRRV